MADNFKTQNRSIVNNSKTTYMTIPQNDKRKSHNVKHMVDDVKQL